MKLDNGIYNEELLSKVIRKEYKKLRKKDKTKLLSYLNKEYGLIPATLCSKFTGKNEFSKIELRVINKIMNN
jgi:hypothetical protein